MLPENPDILLSVVNMKLRDAYPSLERLCDVEDVSEKALTEKLAAAGWIYDKKTNSFIKRRDNNA